MNIIGQLKYWVQELVNSQYSNHGKSHLSLFWKLCNCWKLSIDGITSSTCSYFVSLFVDCQICRTKVNSLLEKFTILNLNCLCRFMKDRKPFNLKWIIICYNTCQIVACALIVERVRYLFNWETWINLTTQ